MSFREDLRPIIARKPGGREFIVIALSLLLHLFPITRTVAISPPPTLPQQCHLNNLPQRLRFGQLTFTFIAKTMDGSDQYQLYEVLSPSLLAPFPYVVKLRGKGCQGIYSNPMGDPDDYLHQAMPLAVARQLTVDRLKDAIRKAGGLSAFRQALKRTQKESGQITQMAEEEAWAYEQLGLPLPPHIKIIRAGHR